MVKLTREKQPGEAWLTVVEDGGSQILGYVKSGALNRIGVGTGPQSVAVTPDGASVYCANYTDDTVSVIVEFPFYALGTG